MIFSYAGIILNAGVSAQTAEYSEYLFLCGRCKVILLSSLCVNMASGQNTHTGKEVNMETEKKK